MDADWEENILDKGPSYSKRDNKEVLQVVRQRRWWVYKADSSDSVMMFFYFF